MGVSDTCAECKAQIAGERKDKPNDMQWLYIKAKRGKDGQRGK